MDPAIAGSLAGSGPVLPDIAGISEELDVLGVVGTGDGVSAVSAAVRENPDAVTIRFEWESIAPVFLANPHEMILGCNLYLCSARRIGLSVGNHFLYTPDSLDIAWRR